MTQFKSLSEQEYDELLKFPAYVSMLITSIYDKQDENEKAIKIEHTKTFSCNLLFNEFYKEADKVFDNNIEQLDEELPLDKHRREIVIKRELLRINKIVRKSGKIYSSTMLTGMKSFKEHVIMDHLRKLQGFDSTHAHSGGQFTEKIFMYSFLPESQKQRNLSA